MLPLLPPAASRRRAPWGAGLLALLALAAPWPLANAQEVGLPALPPMQLRWTTSLSALPADRLSAARQVVTASADAAALGTATPWPQLLARADEQAASNRASDAGVLAAQALRQQAWATAWMPRVEANASASKSHQQVNETVVRTPTTALSLTATMPLWRAADRAAARAQEAQADQAAWQARGNRAAVARELSLAYLGAIEAAEQRRLQQAQQDLLQEQLRINDRRLQAGVGTVLDVLETRTRVEQTRAAVQDLNTRLGTQRLTLERFTGQRVLLPSGLNNTQDSLPEVVPPLDEALQVAASRNPAVQETAAQATAATAITQARTAERWQPTLDAVAAASRVREVPQLDGFSQSQTSTERTVGVQMNWALFTGGQQQGRTREAAALLTQAQARRDDAQQQAETSLRDAYQTLSQAHAVIAVQREVERTASATHEAVRKAFVAGMRTNLDLLNAQQQIYAARQSLVSARINALAAQVGILALLDQLDPARIAALVPLFDTAPLPTQLERTP